MYREVQSDIYGLLNMYREVRIKFIFINMLVKYIGRDVLVTLKKVVHRLF